MEGRIFTPTNLEIKSPVPSDIDISQSVEPKHIGIVAKELGIQESEIDYYGRTKAKVHLSVLDRLQSKDGKYPKRIANVSDHRFDLTNLEYKICGANHTTITDPIYRRSLYDCIGDSCLQS